MCRRKFLSFFPEGFYDVNYLAWERDYKWAAHRAWREALGRAEFTALLDSNKYTEIATRAVRIESRTNLLFSFEKMALRDAVRSRGGARTFAVGLFDWLYGPGAEHNKFTRWCDAVAALPRKQTRVLTWPVVTVFGFMARPRVHMFLKPAVTKAAAEACGFDFRYHSRPQWDTYASLLDIARHLRAELADMRPRDMIDIQSYLWVQGSSEYD
jgi:hypothetical protein